jgi:hypothetical protein
MDIKVSKWLALEKLRLQYFPKETHLPETLKNKEHIHFMLYRNSDIIGYAHIQIASKEIAKLIMLIIDKEHQRLGFQDKFLNLCKRWALHQKIENLTYSPKAFHTST